MLRGWDLRRFGTRRPVGRPRRGVREARSGAGRRAAGAERRVGAARRGGDRQVGAVGVRCRARGGLPCPSRDRGGMGDGACRSQPCISCVRGCSTVATRLPEPQSDAIATAFGLNSGPQPDRFLVGLAVLSLLSDAAEEHPLVCLVDDVQWLDRSSAQVLAFVARRLEAESVVLLFAERDPSRLEELTGSPRCGSADCRTSRRGICWRRSSPLLLDEPVRARILAETRGNPLALLELPREFPAERICRGFRASERRIVARSDRSELPAAGAAAADPDPAATAPGRGRPDGGARTARSRLGGDRRSDRSAVSCRG